MNEGSLSKNKGFCLVRKFQWLCNTVFSCHLKMFLHLSCKKKCGQPRLVIERNSSLLLKIVAFIWKKLETDLSPTIYNKKKNSIELFLFSFLATYPKYNSELMYKIHVYSTLLRNHFSRVYWKFWKGVAFQYYVFVKWQVMSWNSE